MANSRAAPALELEVLLKAAKWLGAERVRQQALDLEERTRAERFYVACLGQFKRGKSSLLNALIGAEVLPRGIVPVTAVPTIVRYGPELAARIRTDSGEWQEIHPVELEAYVSEEKNPGNCKRIGAVEVFTQSPLLASGMCLVDAMSCASGTMGIGDGFRQIRDDYADVMICGGVEAPLNQLCFGAFAIIRAMSTRNGAPERASRPFDRERDGFVMGEGAAILVLEEYARAKSRGAHIYAEVCGYAFCNDAHHMTAPRPDGSQAARAIRGALADAHVSPREIAYVNAHGSSTPLNDPTETKAIKSVFGEHARTLQVSSTKGYYGHALGASGAMEAAICALSLERGWLPPTLNLENPDEGCDLDYIPGEGRDASVEYALSNSFGFGGINAALVFKRAD